MILIEKNRRTRRKTCPSATLSASNPTWTALGANTGLRGENSITNHLSYGMAPNTHLSVSSKRRVVEESKIQNKVPLGETTMRKIFFFFKQGSGVSKSVKKCVQERIVNTKYVSLGETTQGKLLSSLYSEI
jgi:hypothetical protein